MPFVIAGLGISVFAVFGALAVLGGSHTHTATHGGAGISGYLDWLTHGGPFTGTLNVAAKAARAVISRVAGAQVKHLAQFFGALAFLVGYTYKTNANTADAAANATAKIKHDLHRAEKQLHREVLHAEAKLTHELHVAERHLGAEVRTEERRLNHQARALHHATHAVDVALPREIGHIRTRNETLTRDQAKLKERTKSLEDGAIDTWDWIKAHPLAGVTGVFAGAVAVALARLGFGFMRCRSWQNVGRSLTCGMGRWIADLLGLIATFALGGLSVLKPEVLAEATVAAVDEIEPILAAILRD